MFNKKWKVMVVLAALEANASAYAAFVPGPWDGVWLELQEKAQLANKKAADWSIPGPNTTPLKFDSGKGNCYLHIRQLSSDEFDIKSFCNVNGVWEEDSVDTLYPMGEGMIGQEWAKIYVSTENFSARSGRKWLGYEGTLTLKANFDSSNEIKGITSNNPSVGLFYIGNRDASIAGTTGSGSLKVKFVPTSDVPQGAKACLSKSEEAPSYPCNYPW